MTHWDQCLLGIRTEDRPDELTLRTLFKRQIEKSRQLEQDYKMWKIYNDQQVPPLVATYPRMEAFVRHFLEQQQLEKNRNVLSNNPGWASPAQAPRGACRQQFYQGRCTNQNCAWDHNVVNPDVKGKGKGKGKSKRSPSVPPRRSQSRDDNGKGKNKGKGKGKDEQGKGKGKNKGKDTYRPRTPTPPAPKTRGTSPSGEKDSKLCKFYQLGKCTSEGTCKFWHPGPCRDFAKGRCSNDRCVFQHSKPASPARSEQNEEGSSTPRRKKRSESKAGAKPKAKAKAMLALPLNQEGSPPV